MLLFPTTIILRHRKENLKKCSLRGLETRKDCLFLTYPTDSLPPLSSYFLLTLDAPLLSMKDAQLGIFLIDSTWRYLDTMMRCLDIPDWVEKRSLPPSLTTAYPRRQTDCPDPVRGLASIEALYASYAILGRDTKGLLDQYYWKEKFLELNPTLTF